MNQNLIGSNPWISNTITYNGIWKSLKFSGNTHVFSTSSRNNNIEAAITMVFMFVFLSSHKPSCLLSLSISLLLQFWICINKISKGFWVYLWVLFFFFFFFLLVCGFFVFFFFFCIWVVWFSFGFFYVSLYLQVSMGWFSFVKKLLEILFYFF